MYVTECYRVACGVSVSGFHEAVGDVISLSVRHPNISTRSVCFPLWWKTTVSLVAYEFISLYICNLSALQTFLVNTDWPSALQIVQLIDPSTLLRWLFPGL